MDYRALTKSGPLRRLALLIGPGLVLVVLGLLLLGGGVTGIGTVLLVVGVLVYPLAGG